MHNIVSFWLSWPCYLLKPVPFIHYFLILWNQQERQVHLTWVVPLTDKQLAQQHTYFGERIITLNKISFSSVGQVITRVLYYLDTGISLLLCAMKVYEEVDV
jgi:hypothetical protein